MLMLKMLLSHFMTRLARRDQRSAVLHNGYLINVPTDDLTPKLSNLRSGYYHQPMTLIDAYKFSFFPSTIKLWNQLPADVINSSTPNEFCNNLSNFYDHTCGL